MPYPDWYIVCRIVDTSDSPAPEYGVIRGDQVIYSPDLLERKDQREILGYMEYNSATYRTATVLPERQNRLEPGAEVQAVWRGRSVLTTDPGDAKADDLASLPTLSGLEALVRPVSR